jgi:dinuclear metal center YbgI/SA1388 family protein
MTRVAEIAAFLDSFAPTDLAESWDNVGLLLGDEAADVAGVMTCLTLTPDVAAEAIRERASLIVTHHPILFRPIKRLTSETTEGATLLALVRAGVAVHSPHTAFDGAAQGINARLCTRLGLEDVKAMRPLATPEASSGGTITQAVGAGRFGVLRKPVDFEQFAGRVKKALGLSSLDAVPSTGHVSKVGVACGSAAEFLPDALAAGCDVLVTGEARFHAAVEARTRGIGLVLVGHYASERFAVEELAAVIGREFSGLKAWPSRDERDPLRRF